MGALVTTIVLSIVITTAFPYVRRWQIGRRVRQLREAYEERVAERREKERRQREEALQAQRDRTRRLYLARQLQIVLSQISQAPDFRRAASRAVLARELPVGFRRKQFQRFRPLMVTHFARCLAMGVDLNILMSSLTELVESLGISHFEAQYIQHDARRRLPRPTEAVDGDSPRGFRQNINRLNADHQQRLDAILSSNLHPEIAEQLTEVEHDRFRNEVLGVEDEE